MIKIVDVGPIGCPVVECDRCGDLITGRGTGAVVWTWTVDGAGPLEFRHKGPCFPMSERRPWRELDEFLAQLGRNVESDPRTDPTAARST